MTLSSISPLSKLWFKWKTLKLPWRNRWLAGSDLAGNTFWYFKSGLSPRPRRILQSNPQIPYSDLQISPQWHQWLRYTRPSAPTIPEQQADVERQRELKYLAQAADERWAAKPSVLDKPKQNVLDKPAQDVLDKPRQEIPQIRDGEQSIEGADTIESRDSKEMKRTKSREQKENPWKVKQGNPGEGWQPEAWIPKS